MNPWYQCCEVVNSALSYHTAMQKNHTVATLALSQKKTVVSKQSQIFLDDIFLAALAALYLDAV